MISPEANLLNVERLGKKFGGIQALSDYHVGIDAGELVGLIGPNGAGKTTVFNLLSGVFRPDSGLIRFNGSDVTHYKPHGTAVAGIARTFQNIRIFGDLSVIDNIKVAFHMRLGQGFWSTLFHLPGYRRSEKEIARLSGEFLELLQLEDVRHETAGNLPYGRQRRVEIARALAAQPKLLLLDEPAAGMNINETEELINTIRSIRDEYGVTIFLVEHDMSVVMSICERIQVLDHGSVLTEGLPEAVRNDARVIEAYLGAPKERKHAEN